MKTGPNDKSPAIPRLFSRGCGAIFFALQLPLDVQRTFELCLPLSYSEAFH